MFKFNSQCKGSYPRASSFDSEGFLHDVALQAGHSVIIVIKVTDQKEIVDQKKSGAPFGKGRNPVSHEISYELEDQADPEDSIHSDKSVDPGLLFLGEGTSVLVHDIAKEPGIEASKDEV